MAKIGIILMVLATAVTATGRFAVNRVTSSEAGLLQAIEHGDNFEFDKAIVLLDQIAEDHPSDAMIVLVRGTMNRKAGFFDAAIADFNEAIELDPSNEMAYCQRAFAYQQQAHSGWAHQALKDTRVSLDLQSINPLAHIIRANALVDLDRYQSAVDEYNTAIRQNPASFSAFGGRAVVFSLLGKHTQANSDIKKALRLGPTDPDRVQLETIADDIAKKLRPRRRKSVSRL